MINFWRWFFRGTGGGPGIRRFLDWWLVLHICVGFLMAIILPITLEKAGTGLLLPIAGIFIGLSFAWGGNAQALLQSQELEKLSQYHAGGYEEYLYTYQAAVLLILATLAAWGIAGLGIFDQVWPMCQEGVPYRFIIGILFFLASMTLRECWHVVLGSQALLLTRFKIRQINNKNGP